MPAYEILPADAVQVPEVLPGLKRRVDVIGEDEGAEDESQDGDEDAEDEDGDGARLEVALGAGRHGWQGDPVTDSAALCIPSFAIEL